MSAVENFGVKAGNCVREFVGPKIKNVKTFYKNNSTFGRMYTFNESFGTAFVNALKNQYAETKAYFCNAPYQIPSVKFAMGFKAGLTGQDVEDKTVPVKSSVPRLEYDM